MSFRVWRIPSLKRTVNRVHLVRNKEKRRRRRKTENRRRSKRRNKKQIQIDREVCAMIKGSSSTVSRLEFQKCSPLKMHESVRSLNRSRSRGALYPDRGVFLPEENRRKMNRLEGSHDYRQCHTIHTHAHARPAFLLDENDPTRPGSRAGPWSFQCLVAFQYRTIK